VNRGAIVGTARLRLLDIALLLTAVVIAVSAYLRLSEAGSGCLPWPECYGRLGAAAPDTWARTAHRLSASALGAVILAIALAALRRGERHRLSAFTALALTVFLALVGLRSGDLRVPAVVVANLLGGMALLSVLFWYRLRAPETRSGHASALIGAGWPGTALALVALAVLLGAFSSGHFGLRGCIIAGECPGLGALAGGLPAGGPWQPLPTDAGGTVVPAPWHGGLYAAHRLIGLTAALWVAALALALWRRAVPLRGWALLLLALAGAEAALGAAAGDGLPAGLAVAHNGLAALLLLILLGLLAQSRRRSVRSAE